jgi:ketosteroid isomerase-like protein
MRGWGFELVDDGRRPLDVDDHCRPIHAGPAGEANRGPGGDLPRVGERFHGPEGVAEAVRRWTGAWAEFEFDVQELIDAGDRVVMVLRQVGRGKGSGAPVEMTMGWLYELRDGKIVRVSMFADREEALAAAGRAPDRD